jgi:hypothetical protein
VLYPWPGFDDCEGGLVDARSGSERCLKNDVGPYSSSSPVSSSILLIQLCLNSVGRTPHFEAIKP